MTARSLIDLRAVAALAAVTAAALALGLVLPSLGAPALALVLGIGLRQLHTPSPEARRVNGAASRLSLQLAIVLLGGTFGLGRVAAIGGSSLPLMLGTLTVALLAAAVIGRALGVEQNLRTLVGVGTAICGASAIGAVSGVIAATEAEIAYAISTIFVFNVVAVVFYPAIGHLLGLGQHAFGLWAGTAVNDTSSVVAAAATYGHTAARVAIVTKLARATMIVPVAAGLAVLEARRSTAGERVRLHRLVPGFLVWFLLAAALNTAGLIGPGLAAGLARAATVLIAVALGGIGLSTSVADLRHSGLRPFALGAALWFVVGVSSLLIQLLP